jgi:hypothetical protein
MRSATGGTLGAEGKIAVKGSNPAPRVSLFESWFGLVQHDPIILLLIRQGT